MDLYNRKGLDYVGAQYRVECTWSTVDTRMHSGMLCVNHDRRYHSVAEIVFAGVIEEQCTRSFVKRLVSSSVCRIAHSPTPQFPPLPNPFHPNLILTKHCPAHPTQPLLDFPRHCVPTNHILINASPPYTLQGRQRSLRTSVDLHPRLIHQPSH